MTCCPPPVTSNLDDATGMLERWVSSPAPGQFHLDLLVPEVHCAACIARVERAVKKQPDVINARLNLSTKRLAIDWRDQNLDPVQLITAIAEVGYEARPYLASAAGEGSDKIRGQALLRALAVAGFAAANIMLLSVSVWSGADASTRDLFHWLSALIALPAIAYAGRPFFRSALTALKARHLNMDVPISLAVILAALMSIWQTAHSAPHAYFDAAIMLLFFLLIGRYLDHMMRARALSAVSELMALNASGATVITDDDKRVFLPVADIMPGMLVAVAAGERIPIDGEVAHGASDIDCQLITGETIPITVAINDSVHAGTMNLTGPLHIKTLARGEDTMLASIIRLMEAAEAAKTRYIGLADKAAAIYAPVVHLVAFAAFIGWMVATGGDWNAALLIAISVLIITCPCALGLAVPVVQVVASGVLFRAGILLKDGAALERLANINHIVFDKTGTLTKGKPRLLPPNAASTSLLAIAAGMASESRHPLARAIADYVIGRGITPKLINDLEEHPGAGLSGTLDGRQLRLGNRQWCEIKDNNKQQNDLPEVWLTGTGFKDLQMCFEDQMREDAPKVIDILKKRNLPMEILSGDREAPVASLAAEVNISKYSANWTPADKAAHIGGLGDAGQKVLMVGDGINDAPALAAAYVSMAPASGSDIGQAAADLVFTNDALWPVLHAHKVACQAQSIIKQNFTLAVLYNMIAIPVAVFGFASPLVAAIAMSSSSIIVTLNALRLRRINVPAASLANTPEHGHSPHGTPPSSIRKAA